MAYEIQTWAARARTGSGTLKHVLLALANFADENGLCWPSQERLAFNTELTDRTIRDALKKLEEAGWIKRQARYNPDGTRKNDFIFLQIHRKDLPVADPPTGKWRTDPPEIHDTSHRKDVPGNLHRELPTPLANARGAHAREPSGNVIQIEEARAKLPKRQPAKRPIPEDLDITPAFAELLTAKGYTEEEIRDEWENFKDHHNACGNTFKRPDLAARKWARNCRHRVVARQAASGRNGRPPVTEFRIFERMHAELQARRGPDSRDEVDLPF